MTWSARTPASQTATQAWFGSRLGAVVVVQVDAYCGGGASGAAHAAAFLDHVVGYRAL
jgi:hypothetical protein